VRGDKGKIHNRSQRNSYSIGPARPLPRLLNNAESLSLDRLGKGGLEVIQEDEPKDCPTRACVLFLCMAECQLLLEVEENVLVAEASVVFTTCLTSIRVIIAG
jgi:hypothetical protein